MSGVNQTGQKMMPENDIYNKPNLEDVAQVPAAGNNADPPEKKSSGSKSYDKRLERHAENIQNFAVTDSGITAGAPMLMERGCTDIFWLFVFIATMVAMLGVVIFGFT